MFVSVGNKSGHGRDVALHCLRFRGVNIRPRSPAPHLPARARIEPRQTPFFPLVFATSQRQMDQISYRPKEELSVESNKAYLYFRLNNFCMKNQGLNYDLIPSVLRAFSSYLVALPIDQEFFYVNHFNAACNYPNSCRSHCGRSAT